VSGLHFGRVCAERLTLRSWPVDNSAGDPGTEAVINPTAERQRFLNATCRYWVVKSCARFRTGWHRRL